ncbi:MAG: HAD-IC family P-type ATPase [Chloroflexota bacterium]
MLRLFYSSRSLYFLSCGASSAFQSCLASPANSNASEKLGIDHHFAQVLPEDKANLVAQLQAEGKSVCFIGDGINDSIALKKANTSISLKGATSMAMDAAQMILMDGTLTQLPTLFRLSDQLESNMQRNFAAGTIPGIICLGGVFFFHFGVLIAGILSWAGLSLGVANAMTPLINYQRQNSESKQLKSPPKM